MSIYERIKKAFDIKFDELTVRIDDDFVGIEGIKKYTIIIPKDVFKNEASFETWLKKQNESDID